MERAEIRAALAADVGGFDPAVVSGEAAAAAVREFAEIERLGAAGRMLAAQRVAESAVWKASGERSPADWLAKASGTSVGDAAGVLETAGHLAALPATAEALRAGRLSPGQARAVAGAAVVDPASEGRLLDLAGRTTFKGLRDEAARARAAATSDVERERRIHRERRLRTWCDPDGAFNLALRGPMAVGARIAERLRPFEEQVFRTGRTSGTRDSFEQRSFDALCDLLDIPIPTPPGTTAPTRPTRTTTKTAAVIASAPKAETGSGAGAGTGTGSETGSETTPDTEAETGAETGARKSKGRCACGRPTPRPPSGAGIKIIGLVDLPAIKRGQIHPGETCEIAGIGPVSLATMRSLMPDAFLAAVIHDGVDVHTVAHLGRQVTAHQRTALQAMHAATCAVIDCNQTIAIELDHRDEWAKTHQTHLPDLDPLCPYHHSLKTHHGWHLEPGTGRRRFLPPDDPPPSPTNGRILAAPRTSGTAGGRATGAPPSARHAGGGGMPSTGPARLNGPTAQPSLL
jgi:hypothetical protein